MLIQGSDFWKIQSRKILCMTADTHTEFLNKRKPKQR